MNDGGTMKHTPGPWEWVDNKGWFELVGADGTKVLGDFPDLDHNSPDGRLIAAAPELSEALREAGRWHGEMFYGPMPDWYNKAKAAIAKAMGDR